MYLVINKCITAVKVSNFSGHYLRNRSTLDIGVLGYIGIVQHKEHFPGVLSIPPGTPCIYIFYTKKRFCFRDKMYVSPSEIKFIWFRVSTFTDSRHARGISSPNDYHPFPGLKQNIGEHRFKDDRELETAVTR